MAKKKKGAAVARPQPHQQDSMRRDIQAARQQNLDLLQDPSSHDDAEDGLDVADQLLATLDARDRCSAQLGKAGMAEPSAAAAAASSSSPPHLNTASLQVPAATDSQRRTSSQASGKSRASSSSATSPRGTREKLLHVGEKLFGTGHHAGEDGESALATSPTPHDIDGELAGEMKKKGSIRRIFGVSPSKTSETADAMGGAGATGKPKVSRQRARMERKAAEMEQKRMEAELELKANGGKPDEAERERVAMDDFCKALHVEMKEITPDGHCLYAAVADQLNALGKTHKISFQDTRKATAEYMRNHPDDFVPFISDSDESMAGIDNKDAGDLSADQKQQQSFYLRYCDAIEKTAVWGGQPEILAMSKAFHTPIHVVQAGNAVVKVGSEENPSEEPVIISYHRHMYGLGEHYNSLRKSKGHQ